MENGVYHVNVDIYQAEPRVWDSKKTCQKMKIIGEIKLYLRNSLPMTMISSPKKQF
jgi:hypothetical protein